MIWSTITSLHSKRYELIRRQNSYAPGGKQRTARREAQTHGLIKLLKKDSVYIDSVRT
jgi:hypothetical protein